MKHFNAVVVGMWSGHPNIQGQDSDYVVCESANVQIRVAKDATNE